MCIFLLSYFALDVCAMPISCSITFNDRRLNFTCRMEYDSFEESWISHTERKRFYASLMVLCKCGAVVKDSESGFKLPIILWFRYTFYSIINNLHRYCEWLNKSKSCDYVFLLHLSLRAPRNRLWFVLLKKDFMMFAMQILLSTVTQTKMRLFPVFIFTFMLSDGAANTRKKRLTWLWSQINTLLKWNRTWRFVHSRISVYFTMLPSIWFKNYWILFKWNFIW